MSVVTLKNQGPEAETQSRSKAQYLLIGAGLAVIWWFLYSHVLPAAKWLSYDVFGLEAGTHWGGAVEFFLYDTVKIFLLLVMMIYLLAWVRASLNVEKVRDFLAGKTRVVGYSMGACFGAITPFCSCSSIPLFLGFTSARIPLGITMSFLITSPLINEIAVVMLWGLLGWKFTVVYVAVGLLAGVMGGVIMDTLKAERWLQPFVLEKLASPQTPTVTDPGGQARKAKLTWDQRHEFAWNEARDIFQRVWKWVIIGVGVGAGIHGFVPESFISDNLGDGQWWSVPIAVLMGIPLYTNVTGIIPVMESLLAKGLPIGTTLALCMSTVAVSLPEILTRRLNISIHITDIWYNGRMEKRDSRKVTLEVLAEKRRQAVALSKRGLSCLAIGEIVGAHAHTVGRWLKSYAEKGAAFYKPATRGRRLGECRRLSVEQETHIRKLLIDKAPDQLKLDFALWTRQAVAELIELRCGFKMPIRSVGEYLKRWGFTPQKPLKRAYEQRPEAVEQWLQTQYPIIRDQARLEGGEIYWGDETGLRTDCQHGRGYALKGQTPLVRLNARRESINMISAITNQGLVRFRLFEGTFNAALLIDFMKRLIKGSGGRKVFLILDNLKVHHAKVVKVWLSEPTRDKEIKVFYLPSYSPELNPDEYLNCDLKCGVHSGKPARNKDQLSKKAISHMRMLQKKPARIQKYFKHPKISYAA